MLWCFESSLADIQMVDDMLFVATMTTNGGTVTVRSGDKDVWTQTVEAGVQMVRVPLGVGVQSFEIQTNAGLHSSGQSTVPVTDQCWVSRRATRKDPS